MKSSNNGGKIELSLLDFGLRSSSMNSMMIIEDVLEYARLADKMGFKRLWLAEHHISDSRAAWYDPLPIIPIIAGMTDRIITGIAGSQLNIHNPYHIAINYKLFANLFPDRIDLGLAGGSVAAGIIKFLGGSYGNSSEKAREVIRLLREEDTLVNEHYMIIPPFHGCIPDIWMLSTNYNRLEEVILHKVNFSRSLFHGADQEPHRARLDEFKERFYTVHGVLPKLTLALSGCCHHTDQKARQIAVNAGYDGVVVNVCGSMERFRDTLLMYQEQYAYDEFTFLNLARDPKDRRIGLALLQKAFDL
ncbi:MAG TPA: LLM class flavin-dependent oxidoreductase [Puia sp.]|jgi:alkanesulfonate monooxygenase SsuD/methylene tetrahydromethanopterin reductase-like flavin-dependent oxidoreductase (luciferase family)|nr:LLM class flavin-dependent oxidoreductase [Puia sp.]